MEVEALDDAAGGEVGLGALEAGGGGLEGDLDAFGDGRCGEGDEVVGGVEEQGGSVEEVHLLLRGGDDLDALVAVGEDGGLEAG